MFYSLKLSYQGYRLECQTMDLYLILYLVQSNKMVFALEGVRKWRNLVFQPTVLDGLRYTKMRNKISLSEFGLK